MLRTVATFDGHSINDGSNYKAAVLNPNSLPAAQPIFISQANTDSVDAGIYNVETYSVAVSIKILNYATRVALIAQLKQWMKRGTEGNLVVTYRDDGLTYYKPCRVVNLTQDPEFPLHFTALLQTGWTTWRAVTADTDTWSLTGTGGTKTITVNGDDETALSMVLTPTVVTVAGYKQQQLYQLVPKDGIGYGIRPWCITLNTQALVSGSKMQADCDDLRIWLDDQETRRWISGPNTTTTKIWFNLNMRRGARLTLRTAIASSGAFTWIEFTKDATHRTKLAKMPNQGTVIHGTEWIAYSGKDLAGVRLLVEERGLYNTTEQAHSIGDNFDFIPAAIRVVYNNSSATSPALDDANYDDTKPLFSLSSSDNSSWVWTASDLFYDPDRPGRPGGWTPSIVKLGTESQYYWVKQDAETGDAAMGMQLGAWLKNAVWQAERAVVAWTFSDRSCMQTVTVTGQKYRSTGKWPDLYMALQRSPNAIKWLTIFNEASPASLTTWENLTNNSVANSIATTTRHIRAIFGRVLAAAPSALAKYEIQTCTIAFTTANIPTGTLLGEQLNYPLDVTITNNAVSEGFDLKQPMRINKPLALDAEAHTVLYGRINAFNALTMDDESRTAWLRLLKGSNQLQLTGVDVGTLGIALSWYRRRFSVSRLVVFDLSNRAVGEFEAVCNRGWVLYGDPGVDGGGYTTVTVPDDVAGQKWLQLGRLVLVERPPLPTWLGVIDTPWTATAPVEITLYNAEYLFAIRTPEQAERISASIPQIVSQMITIMNRQEQMFLSLGETSNENTKHDQALDQRKMWDILIPLLERTGYEMVIRTERDDKNRLRIFVDVDTQLGINTGFLLEDGKNMTILDATVNGEIVNRVRGVSGSSTAENQLQTDVFEDQDSQDLYRTRSATVQFRDITQLSTLQEYAKTYLAAVKDPYLDMTVQAHESTFKYLQPGNTLIAHSPNLYLPGGVHGWRGNARILSMVYNEDSNTVEMKLRGAL